MSNLTAEQLKEQLFRKEKFYFKKFQLELENNCLPSDVDWNYKDVPHLEHIHKLVEGFPAYISDDVIGSIFIQKLPLGIKIPLTVVNYQSELNRQTYFTSLFFFILIIETHYWSIGENKTKVQTSYSIGAKSWSIILLIFLFPLMKWSIKRNYKDLMSGDIPMRERRGELRKDGYTFKGDTSPYSFKQTQSITKTNLVPPSIKPEKIQIRCDEVLSFLKNTGVYKLGSCNAYGVQAHLIGDEIAFFPRTCPHEGANLDSKDCTNKTISCSWHGRKFKPILISKIDNLSGFGKNEFLSIKMQNGFVEIEPI